MFLAPPAQGCLDDWFSGDPWPREKHKVGWPVGRCLGSQGFQMTVVYVPGTQEGHSLGEAGRVGLEGTWEEGHRLRTVALQPLPEPPCQMTGFDS